MRAQAVALFVLTFASLRLGGEGESWESGGVGDGESEERGRWGDGESWENIPSSFFLLPSPSLTYRNSRVSPEVL